MHKQQVVIIAGRGQNRNYVVSVEIDAKRVAEWMGYKGSALTSRGSQAMGGAVRVRVLRAEPSAAPTPQAVQG